MKSFSRVGAILLFLVCCLWVQVGSARSVTPDEAQETAARFYAALCQQTRAVSIPTLQRVILHETREDGRDGIYAFNVGNGQGFVIVSGDSKARPILGYALSGCIAPNDMPIQMRALLEGYREQVAVMAAAKDPDTLYAAGRAPFAVRATADKSVAPLLGGISWNQDAPFNNLCPMDKIYSQRTPAGCVAVAAAQIMRYYAYPLHGTGSRSYATATQRLPVSADFASATYDWVNMIANYNGKYTEKQAAAAALLVYHVGVACKMDYNYEGSGATAKEAAKAFLRYFNYDSNLEYVDRTHYTEPDWEALLRDELDAGRPVLQFGEGPDGGHAFVCDGYDEQGFFHYNWGWGGMSDGYYQSSALDPEFLGIGSGLGSYNYLQAVLTNIQPPTATSMHVAGLQLAKALTPAATHTDRTEETSITASFYNYGLRDFTGEVAAALYDFAGNIVQVLSSRRVTDLAELSGGTPGTAFAFSVPKNVPDGIYRLRLAHKEDGADSYTAMRAPVTMPNYLSVVVSAQGVDYTVPMLSARLSLTEKPRVLTPLYNKRRASFSVTVKNDGEEYYSYLGILLQKKNTGAQKVRQYVGVILTRIPKGATRTFTYSTDSITVGAGEYDVVAVCDPQNAQNSYLDAIGPDELMVTEAAVRPTPLLPGRIVLTEPLSVAAMDGASSIEANKMFTVTAHLKNNGGYADGAYALIFFNRAEEMIGNSNVVKASIANRETLELKISHKLNVEAGQYAVILASVTDGNVATPVEPSDNNGVAFYVNEPTTGIGDVVTDGSENLTLTLERGMLSVTAPTDMRKLAVTDISGKTVWSTAPNATHVVCNTDGWTPGIYLVCAATQDGLLKTKFLLGGK